MKNLINKAVGSIKAYFWAKKALGAGSDDLLKALVTKDNFAYVLDQKDKRVLDVYIEIFCRKEEIDYDLIVVNEEYHPKLFDMVQALQGRTSFDKSMAAYEWVMENYPELKELSDRQLR